MLELVFIWAIAIFGLGFGALMVGLFARSVLRELGRIVFVEDDANKPSVGAA